MESAKSELRVTRERNDLLDANLGVEREDLSDGFYKMY